MDELYPIRLKGYEKETLWGGNAIARFFKHEAENAEKRAIGEEWVLTVRPNEKNQILNGAWAGRTLNEYWKAQNACPGEDFPLLIKFIDARKDLSVQVHPDDVMAQSLGFPYGKNELWYVLDAEPGATLVYGTLPGVDRAALTQALKDKNVESVLNFVPVQAGDAFFIPAGFIHAIGKGILLAEVQQNCDLTFRLWDYDRRDANGCLRELHTEQALNAFRCFRESELRHLRFLCQGSEPPITESTLLADTEFFRAEILPIHGQAPLPVNRAFLSVLCLGGSGCIRDAQKSYPVVAGDSYFLPAGLTSVVFEGTATLLLSSPPKQSTA